LPPMPQCERASLTIRNTRETHWRPCRPGPNRKGRVEFPFTVRKEDRGGHRNRWALPIFDEYSLVMRVMTSSVKPESVVRCFPA
jgi:hypothetical protein